MDHRCSLSSRIDAFVRNPFAFVTFRESPLQVPVALMPQPRVLGILRLETAHAGPVDEVQVDVAQPQRFHRLAHCRVRLALSLW